MMRQRSKSVTARKLAEEALLKAGALQKAIFDSANFSSIATDAKGVIQIFNVGAERMLGYAAADVMNKITPADISDPQEADSTRQSAERRARNSDHTRASRPWCSRPRAELRTSTS
jgi:PAS domain S-box-containing protein